MDFSTILNIASLAVSVFSLLVAILVFAVESRRTRKATEEQTKMENIRASLSDFQGVRREHPVRMLRTASYEEQKEIIKEYLPDLERFATGINLSAYDIETINKMSGGTLVAEYRKGIRQYILEKRENFSLTSKSRRASLYIEYENMMQKIYKLRGLPWEPVGASTDEQWTLENFLRLPVDSSDAVFEIFRSLPNVVEAHGSGKQGYLYVPGTREDRCVICVHADTVRDTAYNKPGSVENRFVFKDGRYVSDNSDCILGADDRAGCAMAWLLKEMGHSILLLDGEEHGQIGAHYLEESNPELFEEINNHTFMLQLDRRGTGDYKCYDIPVSKGFTKMIEIGTGFQAVKDKGRTDIVALCKKICGANVSIGYDKEHTTEESLDYAAWLNTYTKVREMLGKPQKKWTL